MFPPLLSLVAFTKPIILSRVSLLISDMDPLIDRGGISYLSYYRYLPLPLPVQFDFQGKPQVGWMPSERVLLFLYRLSASGTSKARDFHIWIVYKSANTGMQIIETFHGYITGALYTGPCEGLPPNRFSGLALVELTG